MAFRFIFLINRSILNKKRNVPFGIDISQLLLNIYVFGIIINHREFSIVKWTVQHNPSITVAIISILRAADQNRKLFVVTQNKTSTKLKLSTLLCRFKKILKFLLLLIFVLVQNKHKSSKLALRTSTSQTCIKNVNQSFCLNSKRIYI